MDAIAYLIKEHNRFRATLEAIEKLKNIEAKKNKFDVLCQELTRHETMEEKVFYPVLKKIPALRDIIKHLIGEEKAAAKAIQKFKKNSFDFMWKLRFYKFKHDVSHHADEEEKELFPKVEKFFDKRELARLGAEMQKFK